MARLKADEIKKLTDHLSQMTTSDKTVTLKVPRIKIHEAILSAITHHFEEERRLEEDADRLFREHQGEAGMDRGKAIHRIRKQLAADREFILSGGNETRFSEDKIFHLAHLIGDKIYDDDLADFVDEDEGPQFYKRLLTAYFGKENEASDKARKKILSLKDAPFEGSPQWETLYRKYFEDELKRLGHV